MNIQEEKRMYLERELADYEEYTPMSDEERQVLHEWVASGRSVHDNGSYACNVVTRVADGATWFSGNCHPAPHQACGASDAVERGFD